MIDTLDVFHYFPHRIQYNTCYKCIDALTRKKGQALHEDDDEDENKKKRNRKDKEKRKNKDKKPENITTAFKSKGILRITLKKEKCRYKCTMSLKPALMIHPNTTFRLANERDYFAFRLAINEFIASVNAQCGEALLPSIEDWHTGRIDYAVNIVTPYISEYIQLFHAGMIPRGFKLWYYPTGFYLTSKNGTINFYDKLYQVRKKFGLSNTDIENELHGLPSGMLRLEYQCRNKYIQHLKEHYQLEDTTLPYLWNATIAENVLKSRVKSIIGKNDFYSYDICERKLEQHYERRTLALCCQIIRFLRDSQYVSLHDLSIVLGKHLPRLLHIIREVGVNPIPLDKCINCSVTELKNPYRLIRCA